MNKYKMIIVKDTKESLAYAINELHNSLKQGGGVGIDVSDLNKQDQKEAMELLEKESRRR